MSCKQYPIQTKSIKTMEDVQLVIETLGLSVNDQNPKFKELNDSGLIHEKVFFESCS